MDSTSTLGGDDERGDADDSRRTASWPRSHANSGRLLDGIRVLDLSRVLAGPYCAMVLADLGADVIKVEGPVGDQTRSWGPPFHNGTAAYYYGANRNKWDIVLDLAAADDRKRLADLICDCDVLIQNFTGVVARKLAVDFDSVRELQPAVVHLTLSGFGPEDPDRRGYDVITQALSGIMASTGDSDRPPAKVGVPISDLSAALFGVIAVVSALHARERHGQGARLDVSLYDATLALLANQSANWLLCGQNTPRMGSEHPSLAPYGAFATADGEVVVGVGTEAQFHALCAVLAAPELPGDPRFVTNGTRVEHRQELRTELEARLRRRRAVEWIEHFLPAGVPSAVVRTVGEALGAPETQSVETIDHPQLGPIGVVMGPIRVDGEYQRPYLAPPSHGEHTEAILGRDDVP